MKKNRFLLCVSAFATVAAFAPAVAAGEPLSPQDSLRTLRTRPGFEVELVAAEPLIQSPVAFDWGQDGKLWVVEMRDYPLGMDNKGKPGGRIVCLEDSKGAGRYDKATVFLDNLLFPTGVMSWGKGVLVTCAPEIFYAEDTDGDGRADVKRVLFTGFGEANPQHRVNGLRWGLDNWVYCANGDFAAVRSFSAQATPGKLGTGFSASQAEDLRRLALAGAAIRSVKSGATYGIRNRDFRIKPDEGLLDPQSGQAQFGRDRDDWGNWFGCNNAIPLWHFALDDHYLRRNPHAHYPNPRVEMPRSMTYPLGAVGRETGTKRSGEGNAWTSACGVTVYRDELFGAALANSWFVCEPVHNLVHRSVLVADGTTFTSRRAADEQTSEFLSSTDTMFSPVALRTGPDGALWVADMYRKVLEHPHWLPPGWEKTIDVRAGHDRGRIYRVFPSGHRPRAVPRLDRLNATGLVALLENPNGWLRDKSQEMLVQKNDPSAVQPLEALAKNSTRPLGRLHALCTLDGVGALRPDVLQAALGDAHPGVRRHAARLSESPRVRSAGVESALLKLATDSDPLVRLQLACTLGSWESAAAARTLGQLLRDNAGNPHLVTAAVSSLNIGNLAAVVEQVLVRKAELPPAIVENLLKTALGVGETQSLQSLIALVTEAKNGHYEASQYAAAAGWFDALDQSKSAPPEVTRKLDKLLTAARESAADGSRPLAERLEAVRLLGRKADRLKQDSAILKQLLAPQVADQLQFAAANGLGRFPGFAAGTALLEGWKGYTPTLRAQVLEVLLRRADGPAAVLAHLDKGALLPQDIPLSARRRLTDHPSENVRVRAAKVFTDRVDPDRNKVVVAYESALRLKGDSERGQQHFAKHCVACHRLGGVGNNVGPDLAMTRDKPPEWFLPALLDPSRAVEARYLNYMVLTKDGKVLTGVLREESGNQLTLIGPTGQPQVVSRADVEELRSTGKSAMPDGLEKELKQQDVADLIAYLRTGGQRGR